MSFVAEIDTSFIVTENVTVLTIDTNASLVGFASNVITRLNVLELKPGLIRNCKFVKSEEIVFIEVVTSTQIVPSIEYWILFPFDLIVTLSASLIPVITPECTLASYSVAPFDAYPSSTSSVIPSIVSNENVTPPPLSQLSVILPCTASSG